MRRQTFTEVSIGLNSFVVDEPSAFAAADAGIDAARLHAPMAGVVSQLRVQAGMLKPGMGRPEVNFVMGVASKTPPTCPAASARRATAR